MRLLPSLNRLAPLAAALLLAARGAAAQSPKPFTLADGDRVVLLGSTLIERDQSHGYLETALTARFHQHKIQFRNLGWSGDTVFGEARAGFGKPADGFDHLKRHVLELQPTVTLLGYGANESFAGREGLAPFAAGLDALLAVLDETKTRVVFLAPTPHEDLGRPLPDPTLHNRDLALYTAAIARLAQERGAPFVNLFEQLGQKLEPSASIPLTDNGLHLTAYGYWRAVPAIEQELGLPPRRWSIEIDAQRRNITAAGVTIGEAKFSPGAIRFRALDAELPLLPPPADALENGSKVTPPRVVRVFGLPAGQYALTVDGKQLATAAAEKWAGGVDIATGPDFDQVEQLRGTIREKNELYFYRWRPQNITYLFGFRKHEQGQNAVEIPQFDPLVEAKEAEIHKLAAPVARRYEITLLESR